MSSNKYAHQKLYLSSFNQKGITLVELLIVLALLTIVIGIGLSFYQGGMTAFTRGSRQVDMHFNLSQTSKFITDELRYASDVEIHTSIPNTLDATRRYIYVQDDAIKHVDGVTTTTTVLNENVSSRTYTLSFSKFVDASSANNGRSVDFTVTANESGQDYSIQSQIHPLNLGSNVIRGQATGPVISYKTSSNLITFFAFLKDPDNAATNSGLANNAYAHIQQPNFEQNTPGEITVGVPASTSLSSLNGLVASFISTGTGTIVTVNGTPQSSGSTPNDFRDSKNNPLVYSVIGADGLVKATYNVKVLKQNGTKPVVNQITIYKENSPVNPNTWGPDGPGDQLVDPGERLNFVYVYDDFGTGEAQGNTIYELLQNSEAQKDVFQPIAYNLADPGAGVNRHNIILFRVPPGTVYDGKAYQIRVTPISILGTVGDPVVSRNKFYMMKRGTISDFMKALLKGDGLLTRYETINVINFDTAGVSFSIRAVSSNSSGGSSLMKDVYTYVPQEDTSSYTMLIDAQLNRPNPVPYKWAPGGYGVLVNGNVAIGSENIDTGYMLQFDPGANSLLVRRIIDGSHENTADIGATPTNSDGAIYGGIYSPYNFKNANFLFPTNSGNANEWYQRYKTEIKIQMQENQDENQDMVMRVRILNPSTGKYSNTMWFGNFGNNLRIGYRDFSGRTLTKMVNSSNMIGSYIGIRTWTNSAESETKFFNIDMGPGFDLYVMSEFIAQDKIRLSFYEDDNNNIEADSDEYRNIIKNAADLSEIFVTVGAASESNPESISYEQDQSGSSPVASKYLILKLQYPPYPDELNSVQGLPGAISITEKGAVKQQYAGTVRVHVLDKDRLQRDTTKPQILSSELLNNRRTLKVTFSEPMAENADLTDPSNYVLSLTHTFARQVSTAENGDFNPYIVLLKDANGTSKFTSGTTVTSVNNVTDVAGNVIQN